MRLEARLSFAYETGREARAVVEAVSPDNVKTPQGLSVETVRSDCCLLALVRCEKSFGTFLATLDDLLACISVAEKAFETVKTQKSKS
ncbi:MAG: KEOPS complex subunit Pcc1 [Candidatus Bathyarchaeota archaeon]|nr:KEOPS complex subunit Pcc1 [Candidatus Bathyarchaeota archaeon]MDH5494249.1 KEOPS complex subunit Pcc1 [Candidatus Bathyarchaeota archaeon]